MLKVRSFYYRKPDLFAVAAFDSNHSLSYCNSCYIDDFSEYGFDRLNEFSLIGDVVYLNAQKYFIDRRSLIVSGERYTVFSLELCEGLRTDFDLIPTERINPLEVISAYTSGSPTKQVICVDALIERIKSNNRRDYARFLESDQTLVGNESAAFSAGAFLCAVHVAFNLVSNAGRTKDADVLMSKNPNEILVSVSSEKQEGPFNEFLVSLLRELSVRGGFSVEISQDEREGNRVLFSFNRVNLSGLPLSAYKLNDVDLAMFLLFDF